MDTNPKEVYITISILINEEITSIEALFEAKDDGFDGVSQLTAKSKELLESLPFRRRKLVKQMVSLIYADLANINDAVSAPPPAEPVAEGGN